MPWDACFVAVTFQIKATVRFLGKADLFTQPADVLIGDIAVFHGRCHGMTYNLRGKSVKQTAYGSEKTTAGKPAFVVFNEGDKFTRQLFAQPLLCQQVSPIVRVSTL